MNPSVRCNTRALQLSNDQSRTTSWQHQGFERHW
jgi:hypothetical protein